ncbi:MAG TPA: hypothetical protein VGS20_08665 [Candidatus Acidoferrales bacterium]|nr:hypothetical protein [Candidatus Acidoferrales bacterium]
MSNFLQNLAKRAAGLPLPASPRPATLTGPFAPTGAGVAEAEISFAPRSAPPPEAGASAASPLPNLAEQSATPAAAPASIPMKAGEAGLPPTAFVEISPRAMLSPAPTDRRQEFPEMPVQGSPMVSAANRPSPPTKPAGTPAPASEAVAPAMAQHLPPHFPPPLEREQPVPARSAAIIPREAPPLRLASTPQAAAAPAPDSGNRGAPVRWEAAGGASGSRRGAAPKPGQAATLEGRSVQVKIGRVEIHAARPSPPPAKPRARNEPRGFAELGLSRAYLDRDYR